MQEEIEPPVKVGEILKLGIVRIGINGDPIMMLNRFVIFLKGLEGRGVELNTLVEIKITKVMPKFAFAERTNGK